MKLNQIFLLTLGLSIISCSDSSNEVKVPIKEEQNLSPLDEINQNKDFALDALDKIQRSGHQRYSTFPNHLHNCEGNVVCFKMSKEQFKEALLFLLNEYYESTPKNERIELVTAMAKAQYAYEVKTCGAVGDGQVVTESTDPPRKGMWIFPLFGNQRDLVIKW